SYSSAWPRRVRGYEELVAGDKLGNRFEPCDAERRLHLFSDGAFDPHAGLAPFVRGASGTQPLVGKPETAGVRNTAVDAEHAGVRATTRPENCMPLDGSECLHMCPRSAKTVTPRLLDA